MPVGDVVMVLPRYLSPLGTKNPSITLFAEISKSRLRVSFMSKQAPPALKDGYRDRIFIVF